MMTQSMDPSVLAGRLDNCAARGAEDAASSCAATDPAAVMSQSADSSMLRGRGDNLNTAHQSPARPRTLFSNRGAGGGSTDSGIRCWLCNAVSVSNLIAFREISLTFLVLALSYFPSTLSIFHNSTWETEPSP